MTQHGTESSLILFLIGGILICAIWLRSEVRRIHVPPLVTFFILGILLRLGDTQLELLTTETQEILRFLAKVGLVLLLFRVGLESNLSGLLSQLRRASIVWVGDIGVSGLLGFACAYYLLGLSWITSVIIAASFTATSVGVTVSLWEESGALDSSNGQLLVDVAELDDISAVVLMGLLFPILRVLQQNGSVHLIPLLGKTAGISLLKLFMFGTFCLLFSKYAEKRITTYFKEMCRASDPMLVVLAIGLCIAALADMLGFSVAIGAFFAGLVFSRDPEAVKMETSIIPLYELFTPFFFIGIGLDIAPDQLISALGLGTILFVAAVVGKVLGDGLMVGAISGVKDGFLIGSSMVPRAEIAMVIMQQALELGDWAMPDKIFGAMVFVSAATCIIGPLIVKSLLNRWPQHTHSQQRDPEG